ncbi:RCC1 domain-containing protein [Pimelobacter simplex]|uniref:RCC1 domain-containing protein n=1 Tax=Nocardioides simplex TaxID=2045 RepID=UPI0027E377B0|nr:kelch repeat-containing protein [Pimelobacter simplex]
MVGRVLALFVRLRTSLHSRGRVLHRWLRASVRRTVVAVTSLAVVVGTVVTVVLVTGSSRVAATESFDVAGTPIDLRLDEVKPGQRPKASEGARLEDPVEPPSDEVERPGTKATQQCAEIGDGTGRAEHADLTGMIPLADDTKVCWTPETGPSDELPDVEPLRIADGYTNVPKPPDPVDDPTDVPTDDPTSTPTDTPTDAPASPPVETPSADPSDEPNDKPSGTPSDTPAEPPARIKPAMALARSGVQAAAAPTSPTYLSPNWVQQNPVHKPAAGYQAGTAYDEVRKQIVRFGGTADSATSQGQTWVWNGTDWVQKSPATSPPPRWRAGMVWDNTLKKVILFGGQNGNTVLNDTWSWDGTNWTQLSAGGWGVGPDPRTGLVMAYDADRAGIIMFGGENNTGALNDTWQFKNNAWTRIQTAGVSGAPARRYDGGMAYSPTTGTNGAGQLVMFGGSVNCSGAVCTYFNDTWVLGPTATSWTQISTPDKPSARGGQAMAYDRGLKTIVLLGGANANGAVPVFLNDTWAWTGNSWSQAVDPASPPARAGASMASTETGKMVLFGGLGVNSAGTTTVRYDDTWAYDSSVPLVDIEVTDPEEGPDQDGIFWVGDIAKVTITLVNVTGQALSGVNLTSALRDTLLAAGTLVNLSSEALPLKDCSAETDPAKPCGGVEDLTASLSRISLPIGQTRVGDFLASVAGTQRGCDLIEVPAIATVGLTGASAEVFSEITVCGGGLGMEDWWTYDTTELGGGGTANVNVANGNLVVQQQDTAPVQTRGRLALGLGRVYNSQDHMAIGSGSPIGVGWRFDIGETSEFAGGFGLGGIPVPNLQTVLQPLSMPYIDRDGTRHVFKLRSVGVALGGLSLPIDLTQDGSTIGPILELLNPQSLIYGLSSAVTGGKYAKLCIDQAYTGPPGSNMYLFRYIGMGGSGCNNPTEEGNRLSIGWSLVRPDRVRYDYDIFGNIRAITDPTGQQLRYAYGEGVTNGPTAIWSASCSKNEPGAGSACPKISVTYNLQDAQAGQRRVRVTDVAGRVTSYIVSTDLLLPQLLEVWEPGNPYPTDAAARAASRPSWSYTYSTSSGACAGSDANAKTVGQLCTVTDAAGKTTKIAYTPAPVGPDRVLTVTDRRGTDTAGGADGPNKGLTTRYGWTDHSTDRDAPPVMVTADMGTPNQVGSCGSACQRVRYTGIDAWGRVKEIAEGTSGNVFVRRSGYFWDGLADQGGIGSCTISGSQVEPVVMNHNLCETIRKADSTSTVPLAPGAPGAGTAQLNGVTVQDEAIAYTYGPLGQVLRRKVRLDGSQPWTDANSAITTWGTHDQYFDANGDQRVYTNQVRGNGQIAANGSGVKYASTVDADGPLGYWRLGDSGGPGSTMTARTGPNGTYQGNVVLGTPGIIADNSAVTESTTAAGASIPTLNGFANGTGASSDFTVEAWQKSTDTTQQERTFSWGTATAWGEVGRTVGGRPFIYLNGGSSGGIASVSTNVSIADGQWHHVVFTYDGSGTTAGMAIWIDGVKQAVTVLSDTLNGGVFANASTTGTAARGGPGSVLDELAIYAKVLSPARIKAHRDAALGGKRVEADTLYAVTDQTQELSPRGNNATNWGEYLVTTRRDLPPAGTLASTNKAAGATICGTAVKGNTGLPCEVDTPASAGVPTGATCTSPTANLPAGSPSAPTGGGYASTCVTYEYNNAGQRTVMTSPKAHAENLPEVTEYKYYDDTTTCAGAAQASCDLSGSTSAGGWLKAVVDPKGEKTVFAYDAAGNIARTWERNASHGIALGADWTKPGAPPSAAFAEQVNATPVTSDSLSVSNTGLVAVGPDGTVSGSGTNAFGELGDGSTTARPSPVATKVLQNVVQVGQSSTGALSTCALTTYLTGSGEVWAAGGGVNLPTKVPGLSDIIQIATGGCHQLALDAQGRVWAWGSNSNGQLGNGTAGGSWVANPVNVLSGVSTIGAGYLHSLAIKTDGTLWTWGYNNSGQLGHGDTTQRPTPTQVPGSALSGVRSISGGVYSSYALTRDGKAWSWGSNASGELGQGDTTQRTTPARITSLGDGSPAGPVRELIGASGGAGALMADGTVRVWGLNSSGQLGGGAPGTSSSPVAVPGLTGQVALAGGWATWASADKAGKVSVWGATGNRQRGDGTTPASTTTPVAAGLDVSPFRLPGNQLRGQRDATGNLTTQTTDLLDRIRRTRPGRGNEVRTAAFDRAAGYDAAGRPIWATGAQHRSTSTVATIAYDPFGNAVKTVDARGIAALATYDAANRPLEAKVTRGPAPEQGGPAAPPGCVTRATTAAWTSGQNGHVVCLTSTTYDGLDHPITATDGTGQTVRTSYDAAGRQLQVVAPRANNGYASVTSRWNYDADGNQVDFCAPREFDLSESSPGTPQAVRREPEASGSCTSTGKLSTHYVIDRTGRTTSEKRFRGSNDLVTAYRYDADGNTIGVTDARGHETTVQYDTLGRRTKQTVPRSATQSNTSTWNYDYSGNVTALNAPGYLNTGTGIDGDLVVNGATNGASNPFQVPDGAQYRNVTLTNGAHLTAAGTSAGLMFYATGTVDVCSTCVITMAGRGQKGGPANQDAANPNPGNGGKKGTTGLTGTGGGGGGHKVDGQPGQGASGPVGQPGLASGTPDFALVGSDYLQGSGGGGGGGGGGVLGVGGAGGNGGGFVHISADRIVVNGTVVATGRDGGTAGTNSAGGGGGGGGGIWLTASGVELSAPTAINVDGGAGGSGQNNRLGGAGAPGRIRIDADSLTNAPSGADLTRTGAVTAISYDTANRPLDTLEGAQTRQADPVLDHSAAAAPDPRGLANTRTRAVYNADGQVVAVLPPQAFTNAASLTAPNANTARRVDYDLDGNAVRTYAPRYDNTSGSSTSSLGGGNDGSASINQQVDQCPSGLVTDRVTGLAEYGANVGVCSVRATYDPVGKVKRQYLPTSNSSGTASDNGYLEYAYTGDGLVESVTGPNPSSSDSVSSANRTTVASNVYDGAGRLRSATDALGHSSQTTYTADGLFDQTATTAYVDEQSQKNVTEVNTFRYDAGGNQVELENPKADVTSQTWTTDGLLARVAVPGPSAADPGKKSVTRYTYDNVGNPVEVLNPNAEALPGGSNDRKPVVNEFTWDNLILASHTPVTAGRYQSVRYKYTPAGLKSSTEAARCESGTVASCVPGDAAIWKSGGSLKLGYGANGRVATQTGRENGATRSIVTTYAQHGGVTQVTDPISDITTTAGYYLDGRVRTVDETGAGGGGNQNTYAYDAMGALSMRSDQTNGGVTAGQKKTTSYAYNQAGLVKAMTSEVMGATTAYTYDKGGRLSQEATGTHLTQWSWHPNDSLAGVTTKDDSATISEYEYDYDNNRNIIKQAASGQVGSLTSSYKYAPGQQLLEWTTGGGPLSKYEWTYDLNSNRTKETTTGTGGGVTDFVYNLDNSIKSVDDPLRPLVNYTYTDEGLLRFDGCATNSYDVFDRVRTVKLDGSTACGGDARESTYTYDGLDRQRSISVDELGDGNGSGPGQVDDAGVTKSVYDGLSTSLVGQVDSVNGARSKPEVLYQLDAVGNAVGYDQTNVSAGKAFLDTDGNGNITAVTTRPGSGAGVLACGVVYNPYGTPYEASTGGGNPNGVCKNGSQIGTTGNSQWYRGMTRDGSTGTYQMGTRTYDPRTGAFTAPDAYRVASPSTDLSVGTDPLTANTYTYVNGNPLNMMDSDGHAPVGVLEGTQKPVSNPRGGAPGVNSGSGMLQDRRTPSGTVQIGSMGEFDAARPGVAGLKSAWERAAAASGFDGQFPGSWGPGARAFFEAEIWAQVCNQQQVCDSQLTETVGMWRTFVHDRKAGLMSDGDGAQLNLPSSAH